MFSDALTFHLSGRVDPHKDRILGNANRHTVVERTEESLKLYVLCALQHQNVLGLFSLFSKVL